MVEFLNMVWLVMSRFVMLVMGSWRGWVVWAVALLINGVLFNAFALGRAARYSETVLRDCMTLFFATTCIIAPLIAMRTFAEEKQNGTWTLMMQSPCTPGALVMGKFLGTWLILMGWFLLSIYMPALISLNGRIAFGHVLAGYGGLALVAASVSAMGIFTSAMTRTPWFGALIHYGLLCMLLLSSLVANISEAPISQVAVSLSLYETHFKPFSLGQIPTQSILFHAVVCFLPLMLTRYLLDIQRPGRQS